VNSSARATSCGCQRRPSAGAPCTNTSGGPSPTRSHAISSPFAGTNSTLAPTRKVVLSRRIGSASPNQVGVRVRDVALRVCDQLVVTAAFQTGPPVRAAPRLVRAVGSLARERTQRRRARSFAQANPNPTRSAGPRDPSVSSMGMPPTWAVGTLITGRSPWCSRRPGGGLRGRARDRRGGRGSRRRSPGRSPCRRRAST
jgi:hypothetical protein